MENRRSERFKTGNKFKIEFILSDDFEIKDISKTGICLITSKNLYTNYNYKVGLMNEEERITPKYEVVRSVAKGTVEKGGESTPLYEVGLKLIELNESEKKALDKFLGDLTAKRQSP